MKIAILIRNFQRSRGGAERYCVELTERISKLHEVHVFAQKYDASSELITFHKIPQFFERPRFVNQLLFPLLNSLVLVKIISIGLSGSK